MDALELLVGRESAMKLASPGPDQDALEKMFESALRAPDHGRLRPWRFVVVPEEKRERFGDLMADCLRRAQPDAPDDMLQRYKQSREKFDEEAPKLSDVDRTRRTRELLDMEKDVQRMQREYNEDLFQRKNEERAAIAQKAYKLIEQVAEQEHHDVVLQEAVWTSPRIDITDRILKLLDK